MSVDFEKSYEAYLKKEVKEAGGECIKLTGVVGIPDRLVILPGGRIAFVEMKRPGERPRPLQCWWLKRLRALGFVAGYCDNYNSVDRLLEKLLKN